jgi:hypothetical protein
MQQDSPDCKNLTKPSLKQLLVLGAALLAVAATAAPVHADSNLLFYNLGNGDWDTGYVDSHTGSFTNLVYGPGGFIQWTHITAVGDGVLLFYNANNGDWDTGYVDHNGNFHNLVYGPGGFIQWTNIVAP